jgi:hypothetical protein
MARERIAAQDCGVRFRVGKPDSALREKRPFTGLRGGRFISIFPLMKKILTALSAGLLLASCAPSTPQARIQQDPGKFAALSGKNQELVQQGLIARGMPADGVYLAWGSPSRVYQGSKGGKATERWDYAGTRPVYTTSFFGSYGYGPYHRGRYGYYGSGFGLGPEIAYVPYRAATVWFENNRVESWERVR